MKKPENIPYPLVEHRLLAQATPAVKKEIEAGLASGTLNRRLVIARLGAKLYAGVQCSASRGVRAFAEGDPKTGEFVQRSTLRELNAYDKPRTTEVKPALMSCLLAKDVDFLAVAKEGVLLTDYTVGYDARVDGLLTYGDIHRVEGTLSITTASPPPYLMEGITVINRLELGSQCYISLPRLDHAGSLVLEGSAKLDAPSLMEVTSVKGWPYVRFTQSIEVFHDPFAFEPVANETKVIPVIPWDTATLSANIVSKFNGIKWSHLNDLDPVHAPMSFNDLNILDKETGTVVPASVMLLRENEAGALARNLAQKTVALDGLPVQLMLSLRSDHNGISLRQHYSDLLSDIGNRSTGPRLFTNTAFSLRADMSIAAITGRLNYQPLSLVYGDTAPVISLNPAFQDVAIKATPTIAMDDHISSTCGHVLGYAPLPITPYHPASPLAGPERWTLLTDKGVAVEVADKAGIMAALKHHDIPMFETLQDMTPHPLGYPLSHSEMAKHFMAKNTLLHVVLDPAVSAASGIKLSDLLPEYAYLVDVPNAKGKTPLLYALRAGNLEALEAMAVNGVNYPDSGIQAHDAYRSAFISGNLKVVDHLSSKLTHDLEILRSALGAGFSDAASLLVAKQPSRWKRNSAALVLAITADDTNLFNTSLNILDPAFISRDEIVAAIKAGALEKAQELVSRAGGHAYRPAMYAEILSECGSTLEDSLAKAIRAKQDAVNKETGFGY